MKIYFITDINAPNQDEALCKFNIDKRNISFWFLLKKTKEKIMNYFQTGNSK